MPDKESAAPDAVPGGESAVPGGESGAPGGESGAPGGESGTPDEDSLEDVQEMTTADMTVYEAVAALNMENRPATVAAVAAMTGFPEDSVRRCLGTLTDGGRLVPEGDAYTLGTHDWGLEY